jgi:chromosome segregation ATPase
MPFAVWRFGTIASAIMEMNKLLKNKADVATLAGDVEKLSDSIGKMKREFSDAEKSANSTHEKLEKTLEVLQRYKAQIEESKFENQKASFEKQDTQSQATTITELTPNDAEPIAPISSADAKLSLDQMREQIRRDWYEIIEALDENCEKLGITYDGRSPAKLGVAVLQVAERDTRKMQQLTARDAELATALAAFVKGINQSVTGLTSDTFGSFHAAARSLSGRIKRARLSGTDSIVEAVK